MESFSQYGQDQLISRVNGHKSDGYFVDVGAFDGIVFSNTYALEKYYNWSGICIEANDVKFKDLQNNRKCIVSNDLLYSENGKEFEFLCGRVASSAINDKSISHNMTIRNWNRFKKDNEDEYIKIIKKSRTLESVLEQHNAPKDIDYLSIDVDGPEFEIIKVFPFSKYNIKYISIEYNNNRSQINELLSDNNFEYIAKRRVDIIYRNKSFT